MGLTPKQAYDLSLLANYQPDEHSKTMEDVIIKSLLDKSIQNDYLQNEMFCKNMEQLKTIFPRDYRDFLIEHFYDDNAISGIVYYKLRFHDCTIFAIRGSEELDAIHQTTKWQDWKDNFHMFLKGPTYQQIKMLECFYEEEVQSKIYFCGHSKGGNLSLFLSLACKQEEFQKIVKVFTFNAPGITTSVMQSYQDRIQQEDFKDKLEIYENEHDCISMYFHHLCDPYIIKSSSANNNLIQLFNNHNLYTMICDQDEFTLANKKSGIPKMVGYFINDYFAKLPQTRIKRIIERLDDYFNSNLPLSDLYRVFIYQISKYTNFFDDLSYDEITNITFHDLIEKRKSRLLLQKLIETAPKVKEMNVHDILAIIIENYELFMVETSSKINRLISKNNRLLITKIKELQNTKSKKKVAKTEEM